jgi:hypothetical protein
MIKDLFILLLYNYIFCPKNEVFYRKILKSITDRRPAYFKQPAWPVEHLGLACLACARLENYGLCLSQAGRHRQA